MIRASVIAASLIFSPLTAPMSRTVVIQPEAIVQVLCYGKNEETAGTAFRVGPTGLLLSVNHVTSGPDKCFIAGKPINLAWKSPTSDFSELLGDDGPYLGIDCGGFVKGQKYIALGYGRGLSTISEIELTATGEYDGRNGEALLVGLLAVIPGMSGGAVISEDTGLVVGTVNAENFEEGVSWSVELKQTPVCKGSAA